MMIELPETVVDKMDTCVTRHLKKWLKLAKTADPSILYRGECGLDLTNIKNAFLGARTNTEIILATSRDPLVWLTAKIKREKSLLNNAQNTPKRIKIAVEDVKFKMKFIQNIRTNNDKGGFAYSSDK